MGLTDVNLHQFKNNIQSHVWLTLKLHASFLTITNNLSNNHQYKYIHVLLLMALVYNLKISFSK